MLWRFSLGFLFVLSFNVKADPVGQWHLVDEGEASPKASIEVFVKDERLFARVLHYDIDRIEAENCVSCPEAVELIGVVMVDGLERSGAVWKNGVILDPRTGSWSNCKIWEESGTLKIKSNFMFFSRTQTWVRHPTK